jgi:RES domain-containing protein
MREAWRIVKERHAVTAFSGEGAARSGGRWNPRGVAVVYVSSTRSLAALESLVHLNPPVLFRYVAIRVQFEEILVETLAPRDLPLDWRLQPPSPSTRSLGQAWVREARTAVLAVPSVIIPGELNFLLNPAHPEFAKIRTGAPEPFAFDTRLVE